MKRDYETRKEQVAEDYRRAMPRLTSEEFWRSYLGLDECCPTTGEDAG
mgnify:FL=1